MKGAANKQSKQQKQKSAFETAWFVNCTRHPDEYGFFFRQCKKCAAEARRAEMVSVIGEDAVKKLEDAGFLKQLP